MAEEHVDTTSEEPVSPAQEAVEETPFEGEFDADRARRTIDNLRAREKELEQQLKSDDWFTQELQRRGYELPGEEEEPEPEYDYEDPYDQRLSQVEHAMEEQRQAAVLNDLDQHIDKLAGDAELTLPPKAKEWVALASIHAGQGEPTPEATEQAFNDLKALYDEVGKTAVDKYLKSKRAPSPPSPGSQGQPSGDFNPKDEKSRVGRLAAVIQSRQEG